MDALSEALTAVRMTSALVFNAELTAPWGFTSPNPATLMRLLAPDAERLVMYHLVIDGEARAQVGDTAGASLAAGDIVIIPHGDPHTFSYGSPPRLLDLESDVFKGATDLKLTQFGGGGAKTRFVCGYFGCERRAERLFLAGLPPIIKLNLRGDAVGQWIEFSILHLANEIDVGRPGNRVLLSKMAEALFVEALRRYQEQLTPEQTGWLAAAKDPVVGRALALLHRAPGLPWSVTDLAAQAGASRTVLAERFVFFLGEPPLRYLARWRLQLAARLLETTRSTIVQVAAEVGYESEAAFSRAFSREFGRPPARYRREVRDGGLPAHGRTGAPAIGSAGHSAA